MKIGFIGLGMMGSGMAANLQKAGHDLVVHDLRRAAAEPYLAAGAVWADTPRAVAEASELVFTSLPGPPEVEAVALGDNGLLSGMSRGKAYFDLSTNSPTMVRKINAAFAERDVYMLDSPVSGGPRGARTGKLALWVGGDEQIFNRHKSVLDAMGDKARYVGPIGAGSVAKLVHNGAGYCIQTALAEMFTVGVKAGVEPLALWEAVRDGASGRRRTFDGLIDQFLPGKYEPAAFALRLAHKDMSLATQLGRGTTQIVNDEVVAGLLQIGRHPRTHHAQPDKSDLHLTLPRSVRGVDRRYFLSNTSLATSAAVIAAGQPA